MSSLWHAATSPIRRANAVLSLELKNEGSVARDHLALERTFLAWLRTSLSLVSIGIAVTQLFQIPSLVGGDDGKPSTYAVNPLMIQIRRDEAYESEHRRPDIQLGSVARLGKPVGGAFILLGMLILVLGCGRYFSVQAHLTKGIFVPTRAAVFFITCAVGALVVAASAVILARHTPA